MIFWYFIAKLFSYCFLVVAKFTSDFTKKWQIIAKWNWTYAKILNIHFSISQKVGRFLLKFCELSGAKECKSCRSRKILKNAPTLAIVAVDTAENEPLKIWGWFHSCFNELPIGCTSQRTSLGCEKLYSSPDELSTVRSRLYRQLR